MLGQLPKDLVNLIEEFAYEPSDLSPKYYWMCPNTKYFQQNKFYRYFGELYDESFNFKPLLKQIILLYINLFIMKKCLIFSTH